VDLHAAIEIHPVNTNRRVILDAQIDMFTDAEPEVACLREVLLAELVFFDLETALENFFCFGAADCDVNGDLLITTDSECTDCVAGFAWVEQGFQLTDPRFRENLGM